MRQQADEPVKRLAEWVKEAGSTVFFGGAGVSTESGVPDFRSAGGIYTRQRGAEEILTPGFLLREPEAFYDFYRRYFILDNIQPNACHKALAALERRGLLTAVVTQNVDNLHQLAGSHCVYELHGSGERFYCMSCARQVGLSEIRHGQGVPYCSCGGVLRPDIVLYEEGLDYAVMEQAIRAIAEADLLIIGGTSLRVYPAASLLQYQKASGKKVLIDISSPSAMGLDLFIQAKLGETFQKLAQELQIPLQQ